MDLTTQCEHYYFCKLGMSFASSSQFFGNVASTTGAMVTDSMGFWAIFFGVLIAIAAISLLIGAFKKTFHKLLS